MALPVSYAVLTIHYTCPGRDACYVVLPWAADGPPNNPIGIAANDFVIACDATLTPVLASVLSSDCTIEGYTVVMRNAEHYATGTIAISVNGEVTGDSLPSFAAVLVRRNSGLPARSTNGRNYWPGVPESWTDDYTLTEVAKLAYQSMTSTLGNTITAGDADWKVVNLSFTENLAADVELWVVDPVIRTMRSRRVKGLLP